MYVHFNIYTNAIYTGVHLHVCIRTSIDASPSKLPLDARANPDTSPSLWLCEDASEGGRGDGVPREYYGQDPGPRSSRCDGFWIQPCVSWLNSVALLT